jgi:hypothetical protein
MKFFKKLFSKEDLASKESVKGIHPDFKKTHDKFWYFNREPKIGDDQINLKCRVGFNDPSLLNNCPFLAKIGLNMDPHLPFRYIGFAYAHAIQQDRLKEWGERFPFAELIIGLDDVKRIRDESKRVILKHSKIENLP